jgi:hypothetical protein
MKILNFPRQPSHARCQPKRAWRMGLLLGYEPFLREGKLTYIV